MRDCEGVLLLDNEGGRAKVWVSFESPTGDVSLISLSIV